MKLKRVIYLIYYLRQMKWRTLFRFMWHVKAKLGVGIIRQAFAIVRDSVQYNISPLEWYQFGFVRLPADQRTHWAGTGTMYEFQLQANPRGERAVLDDKRRFHQAYREHFRHYVWTRDELEADSSLVDRVLATHDRLVFKGATGKCGVGVQIRWSRDLSAESLVSWMTESGHDLIEEFVEQHPLLQALSPSAVNTVRIFTLLDRRGDYHVLGCRLRISVNSHVDNLAAGNLAAPIDHDTGVVMGPGVYSDITREPEPIHPVTGIPIVGFQLPFWRQTLELVRSASLQHPQNRSIGWDIVITPEGPGLIEGNHDWCKLVWQLPVRKGLKSLIMEGDVYA